MTEALLDRPRAIDARALAAVLPQRYPFLLVDRILAVDPGRSAVGLKNVTVNEPYFEGHFPGRPVMPGVLLIEALGQVAAVAASGIGAASEAEDDQHADESLVPPPLDWEPSNGIGVLAGVKRLRFRKIVEPGDQLLLEAVVVARLGNVSEFKVTARVAGSVVADGTLIGTIS